MPIIIACPNCHGKLRIADDLRGQMVRCPACNHTFDSSAAFCDPPPPPASALDPQDLPLQLALDEPDAPPPATSNGAPGLVGAVEVKMSLDDEPSASPPAPATPEPPHPKPPLRAPRFVDDYDDGPEIRRRGPRRDAEPDRGGVILTLGIISLASLTFWCTPVGLILGLFAWIMGQIDLRKMKRGQMDDYGRSMTQAGWICGILGTLINSVALLGCLTWVGFIWYSAVNRPPLTSRVTFPAPGQPVRPQPFNPPMKRF